MKNKEKLHVSLLNDNVMNEEKLNEVYDNEYFKLNKKLQIITGLWPYRPRWDKNIRRTFVLIVLGLVTFPHFNQGQEAYGVTVSCLVLFSMNIKTYKNMKMQMNGIRVWCSKDLGICAENIAGVVYASGCFVKYMLTILREKQLSLVYEKVAKNWLLIKDDEERKIMIKFARIGKWKSIGYVVYLSLAGIVFSQLGMLPILFDFIMPLNESRPKLRVVKAEFCVDPYDYFYEIYYLYCVISAVSVTVLMSIDTTYTAVVHQNLAIFNVVKYRLVQATKKTKKNESAYDIIVSAIKLHKDSLRFNELIESTYAILFLLLICICILFLTFGAVTIMENAEEILDLIRMSLFEGGAAVHLFYLSWPGQLVISESEEIFNYTYDNEWYDIPENGKTLLKIMMLRCMNPCTLTAAGLYVMNFENYGSIIKTTVSYITVLASFRN